MDLLLHDSLSLCFLCFLLCDWLLMVRMRPCAEGAQAPHWLPLCSCYCCHCSCAVSGQSHNAISFSLSLTLFQSYNLWLILALFLLMFLFFLFSRSSSSLCLSVFYYFSFVPLLNVFFHCFPALIFLTCHSLLCSTTICLHLPPTYLPFSFCLSPTFSLSHLTLNFKPCSLYLSPSIIIRLRQ